MTRPHSAPAVHAPDADAALAAIRSQGVRVTASRRLAVEALYAAGEPLTAEQIATGGDGRAPVGDLASVYRNLERLEEAGIVRHFHLGHAPALYALAGAPRREYLLCESCGKVTSLEPSKLDAVRRAIRRDLGHQASFTHFPIGGLCGKCGQGE